MFRKALLSALITAVIVGGTVLAGVWGSSARADTAADPSPTASQYRHVYVVDARSGGMGNEWTLQLPDGAIVPISAQSIFDRVEVGVWKVRLLRDITACTGLGSAPSWDVSVKVIDPVLGELLVVTRKPGGGTVDTGYELALSC